MIEKRIETDWGELIYRECDGGLFLSEYKLADANKLWKVMATYATWLEPHPYYVISKSKRAAKKRFITSFPWLNVVHSVVCLSPEEQDAVTHDPAHNIIV